jgi:AbrB family looped-hinge helix DNA binding protein
MSLERRTRIDQDGTLRLPAEVSERLGWKPGTYLEVTLDGDAARLRRIEVDPFEEALRKPDADAFEKLLEKQKKSREDAIRSFDDRVKRGDVPEVRPEDKPDYWR